jgi:hypothetical protein
VILQISPKLGGDVQSLVVILQLPRFLRALIFGSLQQFRNLQQFKIQLQLQDKLPAYSKLLLQFYLLLLLL